MLLLFYCGSVCKTSWIALNEIYWKKFPGASKSSEWITGNISLECFTHSTRIYFSKFNITLLYFLLSRQDRTGQHFSFLCRDRKCANLYNYYLFNLLLLKPNEHCWKNSFDKIFFWQDFLRRFASHSIHNLPFKIFMFFSCQLCELSQVSHSIQKTTNKMDYYTF